MNAKKVYCAVITGDIIGSRSLKNRKTLLINLQNFFKSIGDSSFFKSEDFRYEVFRGDSFQILLYKPEKALRLLLLLRSMLKMTLNADARMFIGIGTVDFLDESVATSDGEAFQRSGLGLDRLKNKSRRFGMESPWGEFDQEFYVESILAEGIINRWKPATAKVVFAGLLDNLTQNELAEKLQISQPTINQHFRSSNMNAILVFLERFQLKIEKLCLHQ
ncbi:SatD family protein [Xanthovirga aplysinae]|uniref:SatD family protein n=1 Tax=Xanthovirga aplysinae TaxID=2529853 RepID=UPI0012BD48C0|nr:SatD family protein [Xanthovirga aplysinae]MTI30510.1 hypothetical protein [Xanthovirga aplysinae]